MAIELARAAYRSALLDWCARLRGSLDFWREFHREEESDRFDPPIDPAGSTRVATTGPGHSVLDHWQRDGASVPAGDPHHHRWSIGPCHAGSDRPGGTPDAGDLCHPGNRHRIAICALHH